MLRKAVFAFFLVLCAASAIPVMWITGIALDALATAGPAWLGSLEVFTSVLVIWVAFPAMMLALATLTLRASKLVVAKIEG